MDDIDVRILSTWNDYDRLVLNAGDVLYLPPRVAHCGTSLSEQCMTLSVGCRAPSACELVSRVAQHMAESVRESAVRRYQDPDLLKHELDNGYESSEMHDHNDAPLVRASGEITNDVKRQMKELVMNAVEDIVNDNQLWDQLVGEIVSEPNRPSDSYPIPLAELEDEEGVSSDPHDAVQSVLNGDGALFRAEGVSFAYSVLTIDHCLHYRIFANGDVFEMTVPGNEADDEIKSIVASIVEEPCLTSDLFLSCGGQNIRGKIVPLLEQLVCEGLLYEE